MLLPLPAEATSRDDAPDTLADGTGERLQAACTDFMNALFDAAALEPEAQRHTRTLQLLRTLRERRAAIIEALRADLVQPGSAGYALDGRRLGRLLRRHFAPLELTLDESALLETVFTRRLLHAHLATAPAPAAALDDEATARVVARLRIGNRAGTPAGPEAVAAVSGATPVPTEAADPLPATEAGDATPRWTWRSAWLLLPALALLMLGHPATIPSPTPDPQTTAASASTPHEAARAIDPAPPASTAAAASPATVAANSAASPSSTIAPVGAAEGPLASEPSVLVEPPATEATPPPASDPRLALQVEFLLRRADAALAALRLTEPYPDSAAANYAAVLALEPANARAHEGLERIVAAYARLVSGALASGNVVYARALLERARTVQPASVLLLDIEDGIAAAGGSAR